MRALLSVYDKTGLADLASGLVDLGVQIISTGGTLSYLHDRAIPAEAVEDVTGFPEILDGRVKTLHPHIHGGLLARRDLESHEADLARHDISQIDVVACNLYPFEQTVSDPAATLLDALENIDIGGPAMIRAAAKNFPSVLVLTRSSDYKAALDQLRAGTSDQSFRRAMAALAFQHVSFYDALVSSYLREPSESFPQELTIPARLGLPLRYGENPHQSAAAYRRVLVGSDLVGPLAASQLQGKKLSYNNLLDADVAIQACIRFADTTAVVVKHAIPCGVASRGNAAVAVRAALECDPVSAFGGIVAINRMVDAETAALLGDIFLEVVIAPAFEEDARSILSGKKNLRLLELPIEQWAGDHAMTVRSITGGLLIQDEDSRRDSVDEWTTVTTIEPSARTMVDLRFAWEVCRSVRSNAIVLARDRMAIGVGPGQPNRMDSVRIAVQRAGDRATGSVLASDAFFPFTDGVEIALEAGVTAVIQPGGSVRDAEVIKACNRANIPMIFTGVRHFLH